MFAAANYTGPGKLEPTVFWVSFIFDSYCGLNNQWINIIYPAIENNVRALYLIQKQITMGATDTKTA